MFVIPFLFHLLSFRFGVSASLIVSSFIAFFCLSVWTYLNGGGEIALFRLDHLFESEERLRFSVQNKINGNTKNKDLKKKVERRQTNKGIKEKEVTTKRERRQNQWIVFVCVRHLRIKETKKKKK